MLNELFKILTFTCAGAAIGMMLVINSSKPIKQEKVNQIICESSSFNQVILAPNDPYLREQATCNINNVNGREIEVKVID